MIRVLTLTTALMLAALPLRAETGAQAVPETGPEIGAETGKEDVQQGFSLLEEGAKLIMRGMLDEMQPTLDDMQAGLGQALAEMEPALRDLARVIGDIKNYHPPEVQPNGDIILRRRVPLPEAPRPGDEIEL